MAEPLCVTHLVVFFKHERLSCALMSSLSTTIGVNTPNTNNIKGAFTLRVRDSRVESSHTVLTI